ncbi:PREDICTED: remorin [Populus euphratica]|uniref:Remorin n=1 Tax=Populus euphratica TaxID=75702 RepID=A0AAJ6TLX9_POPEU|nr:PREDICTED: remorin [Populus euphratica]XP_011013145.1 PREDICTED: remorin [Populus euphratica]XP_011013146.1 PREDICTED: remorin [Populus euphratica]XP_011013148.1 PREDICTED: remorin [Populus euphratica]XP_011013149.1 PREDICTED: remorin [Populus euphratica]
MSQDYDFQDGEFATAVAAAAFVINSLEEAEDYRRKLRGDFGKSKEKIKTRKQDSSAGSVRATRHFSSREMIVAGETSARKPTEEDRRQQENAFPTRKPSRSSSARPMNRQPLSQVVETKADSWEKDQLRKINRRYEKMKSKILDWEKARKMRAKLHGEKKKSELELRRARNMQHYQNKIARIDMISGGARRQLEEKRRNEEFEVKEKAKHMRSRGRSPSRCFCC